MLKLQTTHWGSITTYTLVLNSSLDNHYQHLVKSEYTAREALNSSSYIMQDVSLFFFQSMLFPHISSI